MQKGCGRRGADVGRFIQIAMGSACELEYQLLLARDLELMQVPDYGPLEAGVTEVKRLLASLIAKLCADDTPLAGPFSGPRPSSGFMLYHEKPGKMTGK